MWNESLCYKCSSNSFVSFLFVTHVYPRIRNRSDGKCPPLSDIPAIGAVLQDGDLYRIFLSMLGSKPIVMDPSASSRSTTAAAAASRGGSMKRQISGGAGNAAEPQTPGAAMTTAGGSGASSRYQQNPL